jgi:methionine-rich copper-binding protein CopC
MKPSLRRQITAVAAVLAATATFGPAAALAHVELEKTSPKAHATVKRAPSAVRLTFNGPLRSGRVTVTGPGGSTASRGHGGRDPRNINRVVVRLRGGLKNGKYTVRAGVVAADGHHETFTYWFKLKR